MEEKLMVPRKEDIARYYDETLPFYGAFWHGDSYGLHYGFWDKGTKNLREAILNENKFMAELAGIKDGTKVLDAGCGVGGSSIWLVKNLGANVTGITLSGKQVAKANGLAKKNGVEDKTKFFVRDFTDTGFPDGSFDVVWAIESVCHAEDKSDFIKEAYRLLRPGGKIVVADGFLSRKPNKEELPWYEDVLKGWVLPNLATTTLFSSELNKAGFKNIKLFDKTTETKRSSKIMKDVFVYFSPILFILRILKLFPEATMSGLACKAQFKLIESGSMLYGLYYADK
jgi:cyclopropane fatty-acyl-phospholipid synthase-like methyltransferase